MKSTPTQPKASGARGQKHGQENQTGLRIIAWNIHGGLENKWSEKNFKSFLCTYDIICLSECWIGKDFNISDQNFQSFVFPRKSGK